MRPDPTSKQLRWLAGVLERAASIDLPNERIRVSMSASRELPELLHKVFGGRLHKYGKEGARWELKGFEALALMRTLARYVKLKSSRTLLGELVEGVRTGSKGAAARTIDPSIRKQRPR